jgi:hypothetical protein
MIDQKTYYPITKKEYFYAIHYSVCRQSGNKLTAKINT